MGMVYQGGAGANPARQAAIAAGLPYEVPSMTVNKLCGSGLKAIGLAAQSLRAGEGRGGVGWRHGEYELGTLRPARRGRWGQRLGHGQVEDRVMLDGLWDCFYDCHMGVTAENLAEEYGIYPRRAGTNSPHGVNSGGPVPKEQEAFASLIVPMSIAQKGGETVFAIDEHPRPETTVEQLSQLKPAFKKDGTVTAGNASGINDGAAALLLMTEGGAKARGAGAAGLSSGRGQCGR